MDTSLTWFSGPLLVVSLQEVQNLAQSLGIHVEQAKCDVSKQEPPAALICLALWVWGDGCL